LESIAATALNFGVVILTSSYYICKAHFQFGWGECMSRLCLKSPHFGSSPFGTRGLLWLLTLDLWSRISKLSTTKWETWGSIIILEW